MSSNPCHISICRQKNDNDNNNSNFTATNRSRSNIDGNLYDFSNANIKLAWFYIYSDRMPMLMQIIASIHLLLRLFMCIKLGIRHKLPLVLYSCWYRANNSTIFRFKSTHTQILIQSYRYSRSIILPSSFVH